MNFFSKFRPIAARSPIGGAMEAKEAVKASVLSREVFDAVSALPDEERALVADLMRALPRLVAPVGERPHLGKGDVVRMRLEKFIDDPTEFWS